MVVYESLSLKMVKIGVQFAKIESVDSDLRDAKITVTPYGELMLCGAEAFHSPTPYTHQSLAWFSRDGSNWSEKYLIGDKIFGFGD